MKVAQDYFDCLEREHWKSFMKLLKRKQIDISFAPYCPFPLAPLAVVSVDDNKEVIGNLKVSLEAARAFDVIYKEFHQGGTTQTEGDTDEEEDAEEEDGEEEEEEPARDQLQLIDYVNDSSDFD